MSAQAALADVLAVLTGQWRPSHSATTWDRHDVSLVAPEGPHASSTFSDVMVPFGGARWLYDSPAEALEALHTAALWPFATEGDRAVRWWCSVCEGRGCVGGVWIGEDYADADVCSSCAVEDPSSTGGYAVNGWTPEPPGISALVAVASLGASALLRAASLAEDIARAAGHPKARLTWRVMTAAEILRHHEVTARDGDGASVVYVFSHEHERKRRPEAFGGTPAWPVECPWTSLPTVAPAWPALRALARHEDGTATGVHLVGLDAGAVTLAAEGLS